MKHTVPAATSDSRKSCKRSVLASATLVLLAMGCTQNSARLHSPSVAMLPESLHQAALIETEAASAGRLQSPAVVQRRTIPLRIITYNVHLLPDIAAGIAGERGDSDYRARAIAEQLAEYDIVGVNEAFDREHSQTLIDEIQSYSLRPFEVAYGPERSGRHLIGGGLVLLSRFPIEETHTITYQDASRFLTSGFKADGFAAKGALHARIRLCEQPGGVVDCFLTHLESRSERARERQIEQFASFLASHATRENPILILGDFNVEADLKKPVAGGDHKSPYRRLRQSLAEDHRKLVDVWGDSLTTRRGGTSDALAEDGGRRIDYIFVSNDKRVTNNRLVPKQVVTLPFLDDHVTEASLSDHLAVACVAEFTCQQEAAKPLAAAACGLASPGKQGKMERLATSKLSLHNPGNR